MVIHAALRGFRLEFWKKKEHREKGKTPLLSLTLGQVKHILLRIDIRVLKLIFGIFVITLNNYFRLFLSGTY